MTEQEAFEIYLKKGYDDIMDFKTFLCNKIGLDNVELDEDND